MSDLAASRVEFGDSRVPEEFWEKVIQLPNGCWLWIGAINSRGYSSCWDHEARKTQLGHRFVYRLTVAPLPSCIQLDHLCHTRDDSCPGGVDDRHRRCVNPADLEPVTGVVNNHRGRSPWAVNARKTHCDNGHEFTPENTFTRDGHKRNCRTCWRTTGERKKPGVKPGSSWSPARRAAFEEQRAKRFVA